LTNETEADTDSDKDNVDDTFSSADEEETSHYSTDLEDQSEESDQEQHNCGHDDRRGDLYRNPTKIIICIQRNLTSLIHLL